MTGSIIIRKQKIKVATSDEQSAFRVRKQLGDTFQYELIALLDRIFAGKAPEDLYINIDKLSIDLGAVTVQDFEQHFLDLVEPKLVNELQKQMENAGTHIAPFQSNSIKQQKLTALLYFLENGRFPWWYKKEIAQAPSELLDNLTADETQELLLKIVSSVETGSDDVTTKIIRRLFIHTGDTKRAMIISKLLALFENSKFFADIQELIKNKDGLQKQFAISEKDFYTSLLRFLLQKDAGEAHTFNDFIIRPVNPEPVNAKVDEEGIYIGNAGLILLHPFLQIFFAEAGLLTAGNQFIDLAAQQKAAVLLYYLQCSDENYKEWEMALNKTICGMSAGDIIPDDILITGNEKEECISLLQTVAAYWTALKDAGAEALQNTFILREGKITWKDSHWLIQVERTGVDILLDRLPWGFGTIKFPWLDPLIFTEW